MKSRYGFDINIETLTVKDLGVYLKGNQPTNCSELQTVADTVCCQNILYIECKIKYFFKTETISVFIISLSDLDLPLKNLNLIYLFYNFILIHPSEVKRRSMFKF